MRRDINEHHISNFKPISLGRASYCIQFDKGTQINEILKFKKNYQSSGQITIVFFRMKRTREQKNYDNLLTRLGAFRKFVSLVNFDTNFKLDSITRPFFLNWLQLSGLISVSSETSTHIDGVN